MDTGVIRSRVLDAATPLSQNLDGNDNKFHQRITVTWKSSLSRSIFFGNFPAIISTRRKLEQSLSDAL